MFWKIYLFFTILVLSIFCFDGLIPDKPKNSFGKWWRKNIFGREND
jgi:hypothetical protein